MSQSQEIKDRVDIVDFISTHVSLHQSGRNFKALCPFHSEKTASFFVFPERQSWRCFGSCATGGDVFTFLMRKENMGFGEALRHLAEHAGIQITSTFPQAEKNNILIQANEAACTFFQSLLHSDKGAPTLEYLKARQVTTDSITSFELGLSPAQNELSQHLTNKGFTLENLQDAVLVTKSGSTQDTFRNRLIFPIRNGNKQLVGFGGRALGQSQPKYLNTPKTPIFEKGSILYGLDKAKQNIQHGKTAIIVEGYMDVIACHEQGTTNVVASMGTAITENQVSLLTKTAKNLILALDADNAGREATYNNIENSWKIFDKVVAFRSKKGVTIYQTMGRPNLTVAALPSGSDPDQLVRSDPDTWKSAISESTPVVDYLLEQQVRRFNIETSEGKLLAVEKVFPLIASISNTFEKDRCFKKLAALLSVSEELLKSSISKFHTRSPRQYVQKREARSPSFSPASTDALEEYTLALLLSHPELRELTTKLCEEYFDNIENRAIFAKLSTCSTINELEEKLDTEIRPHLHKLLTKEIPPSTNSERQQDYIICARRLEERKLRQLLITSTELDTDDAGSVERSKHSTSLSERLRDVFKEATISRKKE